MWEVESLYAYVRLVSYEGVRDMLARLLVYGRGEVPPRHLA